MGGGWKWGIQSNKGDGKIYGSLPLRTEMVPVLEERGFIADKRLQSWQQQVQRKDKSPILGVEFLKSGLFPLSQLSLKLLIQKLPIYRISRFTLEADHALLSMTYRKGLSKPRAAQCCLRNRNCASTFSCTEGRRGVGKLLITILTSSSKWRGSFQIYI